MAREIQLTRGKVAIVDDEDYARVAGVPWTAVDKRGHFYAQRMIGSAGARQTISMARLILGAQPGQVVDHRDGNTLDNRRSNLRIATNAQNMANQHRAKQARSGLKGVRHRPNNHRHPWSADITVNCKSVHLGYFASKEEAASAYDRAAVQHFGEFAITHSGPRR